MNWRLKLCLLGILFGFMSCTNKIKKEMELLMSAPINFCDEQLAQYCHGKEINGNILGHHKYSLVVFVDSVTCSPCFWKQMPQWQSIVDSVNNHNVDISFAFVFHVKRKNRDRFIESMQQDTLYRGLPEEQSQYYTKQIVTYFLVRPKQSGNTNRRPCTKQENQRFIR